MPSKTISTTEILDYIEAGGKMRDGRLAGLAELETIAGELFEVPHKQVDQLVDEKKIRRLHGGLYTLC